MVSEILLSIDIDRIYFIKPCVEERKPCPGIRCLPQRFVVVHEEFRHTFGKDGAICPHASRLCRKQIERRPRFLRASMEGDGLCLLQFKIFSSTVHFVVLKSSGKGENGGRAGSAVWQIIHVFLWLKRLAAMLRGIKTPTSWTV